MRERLVRLQRPLPHQLAFLSSGARHKVLCSGRRWGKTSACLVATVAGHGPHRGALPGALDGARVAWVVPAFPALVEVWREVKAALRGAWVDKSETEHRIELAGGGVILARSGEDPDSLRGFKFQGAVVDEAASHKPEVWGQALAPALSDSRGWAVFAGTPKGPGNWFAEVFDNAATLEGWARWQRPSSDNPLMTPEELAARRRELGSFAFSREYEAAFAVESGGLFRREMFQYYDPAAMLGAELTTFASADLAISTRSWADWTAVLRWGRAQDGTLYLLDLVRQKIEGAQVVATLSSLVRGWGAKRLYLESGGPLGVLNQQARAAGLPVLEVATGGKDKVARAQPLAAAVEAGRVRLPKGAPWVEGFVAELCSFPSDAHDDQVDAASLAVAAAPPFRREARPVEERRRPRAPSGGGWLIGRGDGW